MNAYDFDGTIYDGDSSRDFFFFCLKRHPFIAWRMPVQVSGIVLYALGIIHKTRGKEFFFAFLKSIDNIDALVDEFWSSHNKRIMPWYLRQKRSTDLVISASPEFLLTPICKQLGIACIASIVDQKTGKFTGKNCYGNEKVQRYDTVYPNTTIDFFYSDSLSDKPLANIARKSYIVKNGNLQTFPLN